MRASFNFIGTPQSNNPGFTPALFREWKLNGTIVEQGFIFNNSCENGNIQERYVFPWEDLTNCPDKIELNVSLGQFSESGEYIVCTFEELTYDFVTASWEPNPEDRTICAERTRF